MTDIPAVCEPCQRGEHLHCTSQGWGGCRCPSCYLLAPGTTPSALDFPDCRACQMWQDAGASWPRPCKQHYGGEPK